MKTGGDSQIRAAKETIFRGIATPDVPKKRRNLFKTIIESEQEGARDIRANELGRR